MEELSCEFYNLNSKQKKNFRSHYDDYVRICIKYKYSYMDFSEYVKNIATSPKIFWEFAYTTC